MKNLNKISFIVLGLGLFVGPNFAVAQQATSNSYGVDEIFMGPGGSNDINSPNYTGRATIGDAGIGNTSATTEQAIGGGTTSSTPELEVTLPTASIQMGVFSPNAPSTGTATFSIRTYLAKSYVVYTMGNPPTASNGRQILPLTTGGTSSPGTEQFGINLVANTAPSIGANPSQGNFGVGSVSNNYATTNNFRYNSGDAIAQSSASSGLTTYTISYLVNVNPATTPAGTYIFSQSIVVTSTF